MDIKIETATTKFLDKMVAVEKQSFGKEAFTRRHIVYLMTDYNAITLAARVNGEIEGFVIARIEVEGNLPLGHILTLDVSPSHRRKGIAQKLLRETEAWLKQKGVNECRLEVREDNAAAINLYQKLGYKKIGKLEKYYSDAHGLYLKKIL
jgi:ribosomal-protein-alanine acetyltransferase